MPSIDSLSENFGHKFDLFLTRYTTGGLCGPRCGPECSRGCGFSNPLEPRLFMNIYRTNKIRGSGQRRRARPERSSPTSTWWTQMGRMYLNLLNYYRMITQTSVCSLLLLAQLGAPSGSPATCLLLIVYRPRF